MQSKPASFMRLFILVWLSVWGVLANAVVVENLYQAQVPVAGQSEEDRKQALAQALKQVVVKVSGRASAAENAKVAEAAKSAQQYAAQFAYMGAVGSAERSLRASFSKAGIDKVLAEAGIPVWGSNRPALVSWIAVEQDGKRELLSPETGTLTAVLEQKAAERGLPLVLPLMDLEDSGSLSASDVWSLSAEPVKRASKRYSHDAVLMAQVSSIAEGQWQAQWQVLVQAEILSDRATGGSLDEALQNLIGSVAEKLAARYAAQSTTSSSEQLQIEVSGIDGLEDYAALSRFLNSVSVVRSAQPVLVQPNKIRYELQLQGSAAQVQEYLALERRLQPDQDAARVQQGGPQQGGPQQGGPQQVWSAPSASESSISAPASNESISTSIGGDNGSGNGVAASPAVPRLYYRWQP